MGIAGKLSGNSPPVWASALVLSLFGAYGANADSSGSPGGISIQLSSEAVVLNNSQRQAMGLLYGPPDGSLGVVSTGTGYMFFGAARSAPTCRGTPNTQGTYRLGGTLGQLNASYGCSALIQPGSDPNGYSFDKDYAGGGPVLPVTSASGQHGLLHLYHGEWHGGTCKSSSCFYSSLGMALSIDGGASFTRLGEIIQPYPTRASVIASNRNLEISSGTLVIADDKGQHIANPASFDPARIYLYVFYSDQDPGNATSPCSRASCLALARARLSEVVSAAFSGNTAAFPGLFQKFYQGAFTQAGTSHDPDAAVASGHYTAVIADLGFFPSVIYDSAIGQFLIAYMKGHDAIVVRSASNLLNWSAPIDSAGISQTGYQFFYPTLVGEGGDPATGGSKPWLFYIKATDWPHWSTATYVSRNLSISIQ